VKQNGQRDKAHKCQKARLTNIKQKARDLGLIKKYHTEKDINSIVTRQNQAIYMTNKIRTARKFHSIKLQTNRLT